MVPKLLSPPRPVVAKIFPEESWVTAAAGLGASVQFGCSGKVCRTALRAFCVMLNTAPSVHPDTLQKLYSVCRVQIPPLEGVSENTIPAPFVPPAIVVL